MTTFDLYRFSPDYLREAVHTRLAWSFKTLLDAWPLHEWSGHLESDSECLFRRLKSGRVDGYDFVIHHCLLQCLLADQFAEARYLFSEASRRSPRLETSVLAYHSDDLNGDEQWYGKVFGWNDLDAERIHLSAPSLQDLERCMSWVSQASTFLEQHSPEVHAEMKAFHPLWLMLDFEGRSELSFMGYLSSLAWGTIGLNVQVSSWSELLIQMIHELAHQLLFALAVEVPLVFNDPRDCFQSPLRHDLRPMDGVLHACFVSARTYQVLQQVQTSSVMALLDSSDQALIQNQTLLSGQAVFDALQIIDQHAQLSALGERVAKASRMTVMS